MKNDLASDGIFHSARVRGMFHYTHVRDGEIIGKHSFHNDITNEGVNALLNIMFDAGTQKTAWYLSPIDNAGYTALAAGDTHASHTGWAENDDYDEATRPEWTAGAAAARAMTNAAPVVFTFNATVSIRGVAVSALNTKGSLAANILWATALFSTALPVIPGDILRFTYTVSG